MGVDIIIVGKSNYLPTMIPTAKSITLPWKAKSLNSYCIVQERRINNHNMEDQSFISYNKSGRLLDGIIRLI